MYQFKVTFKNGVTKTYKSPFPCHLDNTNQCNPQLFRNIGLEQPKQPENLFSFMGCTWEMSKVDGRRKEIKQLPYFTFGYCSTHYFTIENEIQ